MAKIFSGSARGATAHLVEPVARALLRSGLSPNAVTVLGTLGVAVGAVGFAARGHLVLGTIIVMVAAISDIIDGTMARLRGGDSSFGALLDSSLDRVADGLIFGAVAYWLASTGDLAGMVAAMLCLGGGQVVSYVKARAEGLGMSCDVGVAERFERLVCAGVGAVLTGAFGLSWALPAALWLLAVLSVVTIGQRIWHVRRQAAALASQR
ncbi:phosphatidylinositol phosphate synthase [Pilimelia columellifera]|uniref:Phosphatidylinositol phosphate synthase n=1 Tax=Pilimelia columellifera subsp. columellifera TaxID=706583 RepID=A0ABP6AYC4_9ACTN